VILVICPECGNPRAYIEYNRDGDGRDYTICPECGMITSDQHFDDDEPGYTYDDAAMEDSGDDL